MIALLAAAPSVGERARVADGDRAAVHERRARRSGGRRVRARGRGALARRPARRPGGVPARVPRRRSARTSTRPPRSRPSSSRGAGADRASAARGRREIPLDDARGARLPDARRLGRAPSGLRRDLRRARAGLDAERLVVPGLRPQPAARPAFTDALLAFVERARPRLERELTSRHDRRRSAGRRRSTRLTSPTIARSSRASRASWRATSCSDGRRPGQARLDLPLDVRLDPAAASRSPKSSGSSRSARSGGKDDGRPSISSWTTRSGSSDVLEPHVAELVLRDALRHRRARDERSGRRREQHLAAVRRPSRSAPRGGRRCRRSPPRRPPARRCGCSSARAAPPRPASACAASARCAATAAATASRARSKA